MDESEWQVKKKEVVHVLKDIHSVRDIEVFLDKRLSQPLNLSENVSYRWYLIPDYGPNESRIIWFFDHMCFDGRSVWSIFNEMRD